MNLLGTENSQFSAHFFKLFEGIHSVMFFLKNKDFIIVSGNQLFAEHCGFSHTNELHGKTDFEIFPAEIAQQFRNDDLKVMQTQQPNLNIIELFPNYLGDLEWFITSKIPLFDMNGDCVGLCGTCQPYEDSSIPARPFKEIYLATQHIKNNLKRKMTNEELAKISGLSVRQFERRFKQVFHTSAHQYIMKLRILKSCDMLLSRNMTIADVALDMGFYDQSAFSNQFKKIIGISPLKYVKKHQN
ncbi:MAG: AraC family transcriptional regulator [Lentisphaeria bacterium]|nr:AraC family transcriptional regulator [Lentisphaeria bacterium]